MATTAIAPMRSLLRVAGDVRCKQKKKMKHNQITSQIKKSNLLILVIGGIGMLLASFFLIKNSISDEYVQIVGLILGGIFGLIGIGCLVLIPFIENLVFENEKLKIFSLTGRLKREISLSEIKNYKEIEKENKNSKWKDHSKMERPL